MILYAPNETTFDTNGRGQLSEALECYVEEKRNGSYELEMVYPVTGKHFSDIVHSAVITAEPGDGKERQPFRIYKITKPINGKVIVKAEHISYQLSHIPVQPFGEQTAVAQALQGLKTNAAETCPFTFWTDKTSAGTFQVKKPASIRSLLGGTQGSILDAFGGGEYEWDNYTVKLHKNRGSDNGVILQYGKDITDIEQEENIASTITGVFPFWKGSDSEGGDKLVYLPELVIHRSNTASFPYQRTTVLDCSSQFESEPTVVQLRAYAQSYMSDSGIGVPKISIRISFQALWQTEEYKLIAPLERVNLCDIVTVYFEKLGIYAQAKVVRTKYDVLKGRYEEIELGDARTTLGQTISDKIGKSAEETLQSGTSFLKKRMSAVEKKIASATDGNIVFDYDANGNRTQILAMNTMDLQTATKILVMNYMGIGGYSGGYGSSNFHLGMTVDGYVVAESIAAGTIMAALVLGSTFKVGGSEQGNGVIEVYDANDHLIMQASKTGIKVYKGIISGPEIHAGGSGNGSGIIKVFDGSGNQIGKWDKDGINASGELVIKKDSVTTEIDTIKRAHFTSENYPITWYNATGLSISRKVNNTVSSRVAFFPLSSNNIDEQITCDGVYTKAVIFPDDGDTKGYAYFLTMERNALSLSGKGYGNGAATTPYRLHMTDKKTEIGTYKCLISVSDESSPAYPSTYEISIRAGAETSSGTQTDAPVAVYLGNNTDISNAHGIYLKAGSDHIKVINGYLDGGERSISYNGTRLAYESSSSIRYKHCISPIEDKNLDPHRLLDLPVVQFRWNDDHPLQYEDMAGKAVPGIIAEDVQKIYPSAVIHNEEGQVESWDERRILPGMLALIQEQDKKIKALEAAVEALEKRVKCIEST